MWGSRGKVGQRPEEHDGPLAAELRAVRLEPSRDFVRSLARELRPSEPRRSLMPRLAVIGAVTALLLIASAAMGGMSSAADRLSEWGTAVSHVVAASPPAPGKTKLGFAPANSQYQSAPAIVPGAPPRAGYCAVAGNKLPNGTLIPAGTFLNLALGQPAVDSDYTGAQPAFYVRGVGLTCDIPSPLYKLANVGPVDSLGQPNPPGITLEGNIYPLYVKSAF